MACLFRSCRLEGVPSTSFFHHSVLRKEPLPFICEEPTREDFTFSTQEELLSCFENKGKIDASDFSTEADLFVARVLRSDGEIYRRLRDVFENHLNHASDFVLRVNRPRFFCDIKDQKGSGLVFGRDVSGVVGILALGVFNKTDNTYSLVFDRDQLKPDDSIFLEIQTLAKMDFSDLRYERRIKSSDVHSVARDIGASLYDLEKKGLIHRDVKLENFLFAYDEKVELCDFGMLVRFSDEERRSKLAGTLEHFAPELFYNVESLKGKKPLQLDRNPHCFATDWFSLGVALFNMVAGLKLIGTDGSSPGKDASLREWKRNMRVFIQNYPSMQERQELCSVSNGRMMGCSFKEDSMILQQIFIDPNQRRAFIDFVIGLLNPDPSKRLCGWLATQHPFITGEYDDVDLVQFKDWLRA
jgi:serine/threonine protein kinase